MNNLILKNIDNRYQKGVQLGKGFFGVVKQHENLVFKQFTGDQATQNKNEEEARHLRIWQRLPQKCRKWICEPIRSNHPTISIQKAAGDVGDTVTPIDDYVNKLFLNTNSAIHLNRSSFKRKLTQFQSHNNNITSLIKNLNDMSNWEVILAFLLHEIARALKCLHEAGVIHGDLTAGNILVVQSDNKLGIKLIDFGGSSLTNSRLEKQDVFNRNRIRSGASNYVLLGSQRSFGKNKPWKNAFSTSRKTRSKYWARRHRANKTKQLLNVLTQEKTSKGRALFKAHYNLLNMNAMNNSGPGENSGNSVKKSNSGNSVKNSGNSVKNSSSGKNSNSGKNSATVVMLPAPVKLPALTAKQGTYML